MIILFFVFLVSCLLLYLVDRNLNAVLETYIDVEAERLVNNIVNKRVNEIIKNINIDKLFLVNNSDKDNVKISYDTKELNSIKGKITEAIQDELTNIDNGKIDEYFIPSRIKKGKFKNIKKGVLCDVSIGSVRGSTLFANISPAIPIKLLFSSQINSDINVEVKEYGINNAIIKIYFVVNIREQITMPLTSKRKNIKIKEPLVIDIVNGKIPNYYGGYIK